MFYRLILYYRIEGNIIRINQTEILKNSNLTNIGASNKQLTGNLFIYDFTTSK